MATSAAAPDLTESKKDKKEKKDKRKSMRSGTKEKKGKKEKKEKKDKSKSGKNIVTPATNGGSSENISQTRSATDLEAEARAKRAEEEARNASAAARRAEEEAAQLRARLAEAERAEAARRQQEQSAREAEATRAREQQLQQQRQEDERRAQQQRQADEERRARDDEAARKMEERLVQRLSSKNLNMSSRATTAAPASQPVVAARGGAKDDLDSLLNTLETSGKRPSAAPTPFSPGRTAPTPSYNSSSGYSSPAAPSRATVAYSSSRDLPAPSFGAPPPAAPSSYTYSTGSFTPQALPPQRPLPSRRLDAEVAWQPPAGGDTSSAATFNIRATGDGLDRRTAVPLNVEVRPRVGAALPVSVQASGRDTWTATYQPKDSGEHEISVTVRVNVAGGVPIVIGTSADKSRVFGPGVEDGQVHAGEPTNFTIESIGTDGRPVKRGGDDYAVAVTGPAGEAVPTRITDNGDGTYRVEYQPSKAGPTKVEVTLRRAPVARSPYHINVLDQAADPMQTRAWGPGLEKPTAGEPTEFYIEARNARGERVPVGGEQLEAVLKPAGGAEQRPAVRDNGDGTYTVKYTPNAAGPLQVHVNLKTRRGKGPWAPIQNSPWLVDVQYAGADPNQSKVYGPGIEDGVEAGVPTHFTIEARDARGQRVPKGGDPFVAKVTGPDGVPVLAPIQDMGDGTYRVRYTPAKSGPTKVEVTLLDKPVANSPYHIVVRDPAADPMFTFAWGPGLQTAQVSYPTEFYIKAHNQLNQPIDVGGENFRVTITAPSGERWNPLVDDPYTGTYTVRYTPREPGMHRIDVELLTQRGRGPWRTIKDSPWQVMVLPPDSRTKANFSGIVTLRTADESAELVRLIDTVIKKSVDVFTQMQNNPRAPDELLQNMRRANELCSTFPPLCTADEDKQATRQIVNDLQRAEGDVSRLFAMRDPSQRHVDERLGQQVTQAMRTYLANMTRMTEAMDQEQCARILRQIRRAFEACLMLKDTTSDFRFAEKTETYNKNINALTRLIDTRMEVIENPQHIATLREGNQAVKAVQQPLLESTLMQARSPTQPNVDRMAADMKAMLEGINLIASIMKLPPPRSRAGLEHEQVMYQNLDRLANAVSAGSAADAAAAARAIANEISKLQNADGSVDEGDEEAKRRAREALLRATNNLNKMTGDLVRTAKDAISNPADQGSHDAMRALMDNMRTEMHAAVESKRELDTVNTTLAGSGMMDAAARAAQELQTMFK